MEEDGVVKAPALRPRRRPSVEQPESPSTPATPTKKRGTRLAAKPQLELIDEHAVTNSPSKKPTRKSVARELIESEEKPVTPARRSARVKSNTSLVLEAEEKTTTPAKRTTRIKSNTSIISEPAQDSPRAKRAARRFSQTGSDTELSLTPARARRTRKTSTSSIDKEGTPSVSETAVTPGRVKRIRKGSTSSIDNTPAEASLAEKPTSLITEVIVEEPENKLRKSTSDTENDVNRTESPSMRRSPRIMAKKGRKSDDSNDMEISKDVSQEKTNQEMNKNEYLGHDSIANCNVSKHNISAATSKLIRDLDTNTKKKTHDKNKSLSDIEDFKTKRHRTKSSTTLSSPIPDNNFFSDNESTKKKLKKNGKLIKIVIDKRLSVNGAGNGQERVSSKKEDETSLNTSTKSKESKGNSLVSDNFETKRHRTKSWTTLSSPIPDRNFFSDNESTKKKLKKNGKMIKIVIDKRQSISASGDRPQQVSSKEEKEISPNTPRKSRKSKGNYIIGDTETPTQSDLSKESNKENILDVDPPSKDSSAVDIMLEKAPSGIKTMVLIEDSDSNSGSISKSSFSITNKADDQCVPVMLDPNEKQTTIPENVEQNIFAVNTETENNLSVEPMDIDETMPENISLTVFNETGKQSRKSSLCLPQESDKESPKKSKRKSSLIAFVAQTLDNVEAQRENENLHKSLTNVSQDNDNPKDTVHKTKRKSSISQDSDTGKDILKKSKRKSSVSHTVDQEKIETSKQRSSFSENNESITEYTLKTILGKSLLFVAQEPESTTYDTPNKSKRKPSLSNSVTQDLDKTQNENKTTLVLSQIKDISAESNTSTSPQDVKEKLVTQNAKDGSVKKNLALDYLTSTPVQQKNIEKITMQMNTSVITPTNVTKKEFKNTSNSSEAEEIGYKKKKSKRLSESACTGTGLKNKTPKNKSAIVSSMKESSSDDSEIESDADEESSKNKRNFLDDEAEDAGEDYESGDSQDEEERLYEKENEIFEHGETLTSEDDDSDDTDYDKDSFIVSSAEEDNELLSGSGDDLDMSDNELKMSVKSKKKYNERKLKEQKSASREMYESRHGLKKDKAQSKKNSRNRLDSTLLKSDDDNLPPKKNKRMRLESSTLESSQAKSDTEETIKKSVSNVSDNEDVGYVKNKSKRLSESRCSESVNEKEMTIINTESNKQDPLSVNVKVEPKTPNKCLEISTYQINEEIEQIQVDENTSIMKPNDTIDPLQATMAAEENEPTDDESISENEEIANNYDSVLKQLNKEWKHPIKSHDISLNLNKKSKKTKEPIIDELNLTGTKSSKKLKDDSKEAKEKSVKRVFKKLAEEDESSKDSIDLNLLFSDESNDKPDEAFGKDEEQGETFNHLKRTTAKTDIRVISGSNEDVTNKSLNTSSKKKNRKSKSALMETGDAEGDNVEVLSFFIDTKGDLADKKYKDCQESDSNEPPVEVFYVNQKNKKAKNSSETIVEATEETKIPASEKKKKKRLSESLDIAEPDFATETIKTPKSDKKKKHSDSENTNSIEAPALEIKTSTGKKKKKKISVSMEQAETSESEIQVHKTPLSEKKTKKISESQDDIPYAEPDTTQNPKKKKKKKSESENETSQTEVDNIPKLLSSEKKSRKASDSVKNIEYPAQPKDVTGAQKRKRNTSADYTIDLNASQNMDESIAGSQKKKIKVSHATTEVTSEKVPQVNEPEAGHEASKKAKKNKNLGSETVIKQSKKRKQRDEDEGEQASKISKEHSFDKVHVPRLPSSILAQLDNAPQLPERKKNKVVSTTNFIIEETVKRKNKPSKYLEESVFLNDRDDEETVQNKTKLQKPKVLPFLPLVSTSDSGFTTNFRVKVISDTMEFVAKSNDVPNFKNDYVRNRKLKKLRTYDVCKKQRYMKLNKYY